MDRAQLFEAMVEARRAEGNPALADVAGKLMALARKVRDDGVGDVPEPEGRGWRGQPEIEMDQGPSPDPVLCFGALLEQGGGSMKRSRLLIAAGVLSLAALPVLGQQAPAPGGPGPTYGYPHMWGWGWGWHPGMMLAPFVMLLALIGIVALIAWLVHAFSWGAFSRGHGYGCGFHGRRERGGAALEILEERFVRGEIGKDEFEEKRKLLGR